MSRAGYRCALADESVPMKTLRRFWRQWWNQRRARVAAAAPRRRSVEADTSDPADAEIYLKRRNDALAALAAHGLQAHYYLPAAKIVDSTLADACRFLGNSGYIITDHQGHFVGKIAAAGTTHGPKTVLLAARRLLFNIR